MNDIEIIENTDGGRENYGTLWGCGELVLTKEHIKALLEGKCIATNDGEYATFITLKFTRGEAKHLVNELQELIYEEDAQWQE
jgi:hypothetical protein